MKKSCSKIALMPMRLPLLLLACLCRTGTGYPTADIETALQSRLDALRAESSFPGATLAVEFKSGDPVKIKEGAFENFEGAVDEVLGEKGLIRVIVTIFGRATPVELEYWQVEKA